jgi:hypothetical protein
MIIVTTTPQGGIRVPGLVEWPAMITKHMETRMVAGVYDILPTVLDILKVLADWRCRLACVCMRMHAYMRACEGARAYAQVHFIGEHLTGIDSCATTRCSATALCMYACMRACVRACVRCVQVPHEHPDWLKDGISLLPIITGATPTSNPVCTHDIAYTTRCADCGMMDGWHGFSINRASRNRLCKQTFLWCHCVSD